MKIVISAHQHNSIVGKINTQIITGWILSFFFLFLIFTYATGQNSLSPIASPENKTTHEITCLPGRDSVYMLSPFHEDIIYIFQQFDLPSGGTWEPELVVPWVYNSCTDSLSKYIYIRSIDGCPDVVDTATFQLTAVPPCDFTLLNPCFTTDAFQVDVPVYNEPSTFQNYLLQVEINEWPDYSLFIFDLHSDSAYHITCPINLTGGCVWITMLHPEYLWELTPYGSIDNFWYCEYPTCTTDTHEPSLPGNAGSLHLYPNPSADEIHFTSVPENTFQTLQVFDSHGICQIEHSRYQSKLEISFLSPGIYFVRQLSVKGIRTGRFVKK